MSKHRKSGYSFETFSFILSRDRGVCPGTFAPALVPGQRDTGTRIFFLSRDKRTTGRSVPVCSGTSNPVEAHNNHKDGVPCLIFMGMKQNSLVRRPLWLHACSVKNKQTNKKKLKFLKLPILNIFWRNFQGLVLGE